METTTTRPEERPEESLVLSVDGYSAPYTGLRTYQNAWAEAVMVQSSPSMPSPPSRDDLWRLGHTGADEVMAGAPTR